MTRGAFGTTVEVTFGEEACVVVRRSDRTAPIIARALGVTRDPQGNATRIVLDRRIHRPGEAFPAGDWDVSGAVCSILTRRGGQVAGDSHVV